jgi:hemerythrin-like domain-containing protein
MKTPTQNLEEDHEYILRLIRVMEGMATTKSKNTSHIELVIDLIRNYADGFHHAKEENLLFPAMIEKGFSKENGPIAVMLNDHVQGRHYVNGMEAGLQLFKNGDDQAMEKVYENMLSYGQLLQSHISKENNVLFRMADKAFSPADQENLLAEFEKVEKNSVYSTKISAFQNSINELHMFYNKN